jgi:carbon-monoxide dehydrogenase medium subunit
LREIREEDDSVVIGAMATHWNVQTSDLVRRHVPFLCEVAGGIADSQVRNRGTIGGSLVHADPAADYPAALLAAGAEIYCVSPRGERRIAIDDWFVAMMTTALADGEIVTRVRIPSTPPRGGAAYAKQKHPASRFAMPGVAVNLELDSRDRCSSVRIGVTGAGSVPCRASRAERLLAQRDATAIAEAAEAAAHDVEAEAGFQISALDKRQLVKAMTRRALESAWAAARFNPRNRFL